MDEISPIERIWISGKRRYIEPWMSRGLEISSRNKERLYKKTLMRDSTEVDGINYKNYRNLYNKTKRNMKVPYYTKWVTDCKNNNKELWKVINEILQKHKHKDSIITQISINGVKTYNPHRIVNAFGNFYSTLGSNLAKQIKGGVNNIHEYLSRIPHSVNSMVMKPTTQYEME